MMGNYHVRFLGGKGAAMPPTYPIFDMLDLHYIFPTAQLQNLAGCIFKIEDTYYFLIMMKQGNVYEFFNVETIEFGTLNHTLASSIILSSDDSPNRLTVIPLLMHSNGFNTRSALKERIDNLFIRAKGI